KASHASINAVRWSHLIWAADVVWFIAFVIELDVVVHMNASRHQQISTLGDSERHLSRQRPGVSDDWPTFLGDRAPTRAFHETHTYENNRSQSVTPSQWHMFEFMTIPLYSGRLRNIVVVVVGGKLPPLAPH
ncbi:hypothetical protein OSTOST_00641, partial [Ostertagia ostertagi]